jgi:rod shape-determining protein MreD
MIIRKRPVIFLLKILPLMLIFSALPLNEILLGASPTWVLLFFTYWVIYLPTKGRFFVALAIGVLLDVLQGDILGQNALALILSGVLIQSVSQSFSVSNLSTQQVYIFIASLIYLSVFLIVHLLSQDFMFGYYLLLSPLINALVWPFLKFILEKFKH